MVDIFVRRDRIDLLVERNFAVGERHVADAVRAAGNAGHQTCYPAGAVLLLLVPSDSPSTARVSM